MCLPLPAYELGNYWILQEEEEKTLLFFVWDHVIFLCLSIFHLLVFFCVQKYTKRLKELYTFVCGFPIVH